MYRNTWSAVVLAAMVAVAAPLNGATADVGSVVLGTWAVDTDDCAHPTAERLSFRADGGFEATRGGKLVGMGFWRSDTQSVTVDVVAEPAHFDRKLEDLVGQHFAFVLQLFPFQVSNDSLDVVGVLKPKPAGHRSPAVREVVGAPTWRASLIRVLHTLLAC